MAYSSNKVLSTGLSIACDTLKTRIRETTKGTDEYGAAAWRAFTRRTYADAYHARIKGKK